MCGVIFYTFSALRANWGSSFIQVPEGSVLFQDVSPLFVGGNTLEAGGHGKDALQCGV